VHLREDADGNIHLRNLSAHPYIHYALLLFYRCNIVTLASCRSGSEEEALNYLFVGDTNRHVSETTMNLESSRRFVFNSNLHSQSVTTSAATASSPSSSPPAKSAAIPFVEARSTSSISREASACTRARWPHLKPKPVM
jgi:hypothetical protein